MKKLSFILALLLLPLAAIFAQDCPDGIKLKLVGSVQGPELVVNVHVEKFKNITGFKLGIIYDKEILDLKLTSSDLPDINPSDFNNLGDKLNVLYLTTNSEGSSIPDDASIITMKFAIKKLGADITIAFDDVEFVDKDLLNVCSEISALNMSLYDTTLSGHLTLDENNNCISESNETPLSDWIIELTANGKKYYRTTDENGYYSIGLPEGKYTIQLLNNNNLWNICNSNNEVNITEGINEIKDFSAQPATGCPLLHTDISTPNLRRCKENIYYLHYGNHGSEIAEDAQIIVEIDENFTFISSDFPNYTLEDDKILLDIGNIDINQKGVIKIILYLDCDNTVEGQTHCVTATALPNDPCFIPTDYSGAKLKVDALCDKANQSVIFTISNEGSGLMKNSKTFIVTEDDVMKPPKSLKVDVLQEVEAEFPANGSTYRIFVNQDDGFPYLSHVTTVAIEGCGTNDQGSFSRGFVTMFEESDRDLFLDKDCQENQSFLSLNTVQGMPKGYGTNKLIEKNVQIEYIIKFQNKGKGLISNVLIKDFITDLLDLTTLEMGSSSHPYTYRINQDRELVISFENIELLDSTSNENLSHGYVKFKITPDLSVKDGDVIQNRAKIFFNYITPKITDLEFHTIGSDFIVTNVEWVDKALPITIFPNPTHELIEINLSEINFDNGNYQLLNSNGKIVMSGYLFPELMNIPCNQLPNGQYFLKLVTDDKILATASIIKL